MGQTVGGIGAIGQGGGGMYLVVSRELIIFVDSVINYFFNLLYFNNKSI